MISMLLLAALVASVAAYLLPTVRAAALRLVGVPTNTGTTMVFSAINAVLVFLLAANLFGSLIGIVVGVGTVAVANRGLIRRSRP